MAFPLLRRILVLAVKLAPPQVGPSLPAVDEVSSAAPSAVPSAAPSAAPAPISAKPAAMRTTAMIRARPWAIWAAAALALRHASSFDQGGQLPPGAPGEMIGSGSGFGFGFGLGFGFGFGSFLL